MIRRIARDLDIPEPSIGRLTGWIIAVTIGLAAIYVVVVTAIVAGS